jgi:ribosomal protein S18 acetylase RimI-like enzyme
MQIIPQEGSMGRSGNPPGGFQFVPIRSLAERHHPRMVAHLLALDASDRYLRFGYSATDEQVRSYVESIDFELDEIFGIFNRRHELIALAHLACEPENPRASWRSAEFGVSVASHARGRGYGARLFDHAVLRGRERGVDTMVIHALSENAGMLAIVRHAGASIEQAGVDAEARLRLPPEDVGVRVS